MNDPWKTDEMRQPPGHLLLVVMYSPPYETLLLLLVKNNQIWLGSACAPKEEDEGIGLRHDL
ncbi:hypothetical protein AMTR_s00033p00141910 [Amborella trichopoda]|uniref:Uncharacterized protein n=1 Tax=Amborella trichopoda TaxID=13333 RepID=U5CVU0_AMBTC|nr:hypothetical protein AMTR_s00033p00141910 [Amborella trichopoda]